MQRLSRDNTFCEFSADLVPVYEVGLGEWVLVETCDCHGGKGLGIEEPPEPGLGNPATGPIFIPGIRPGDTLRVTIASIETARRGFVSAGGECKVIDIVEGFAVFSDTVRLPLRPMIGVIGVAPAAGSAGTAFPGLHGGNMDTVDVRAGAQVFLRAQVEGALLGLGDIHACQGDGEVCGQGIEIAGEVLLRVDREARPLPIDDPYVIVEGSLSVIASAPTFEECIQHAVAAMEHVIADRMRVSAAEARMLISLRGDVRISQIVNPLMTARVVMPVMWRTETAGRRCGSGDPRARTAPHPLPPLRPGEGERRPPRSHHEPGQRAWRPALPGTATAHTGDEHGHSEPPVSSCPSC